MIARDPRDLPRRAARLLLRDHIENGASVSLCFAAVLLVAGAVGGLDAAIFAGTGAMCVSIVDQPGPLRQKLSTFVAALLACSLVSLLAGLADNHPSAMAGLVTLTSLGFAFATAFGRPALTLGIAAVLALVTGMAVPAGQTGVIFGHVGLFFIGGGAYVALALTASGVLDDRNRRMFLNEALLAFAAYLRARAALYDRNIDRQSALVNVIERHGALMERLQAARDMIFNGRLTARRRQWIAGMIALLDLHEAVLSSDADWETLRNAPDQDALRLISALSRTLADDIESAALRLVSGRGDSPGGQHPEMLAALDDALERLAAEGRTDALAGLRPTRVKLARAMHRTRRLVEVLSAASVKEFPFPAVDLADFVQPKAPFFAMLRAHLTPSSPVARYAIRLTLAMLAGYGLTVIVPGYVHGGWILLTVALIMRASYAVTRQRRNDRLVGTLAGCAVAAVLMPVLPPYGAVAVIIVCVGVAHAYGGVNYKVTSFAASLMALFLLHFLEPQTFYIADRVIDTLIGAAFSIVFARLLPSWEWNDVPRLVAGLLTADRAFAASALMIAPDDQVYRLARKRAFDRFTALAMTTRRLSSEPDRSDRQLMRLNDLLAANYLFASDVASVQGILRRHAGAFDADAARKLLEDALSRVEASLTRPVAAPEPETLRRRGWFETSTPHPVTTLRRRLLHIEHSAQRLAAQASGAATNAR
jgi:uncharacterized membrane protein YccC